MAAKTGTYTLIASTTGSGNPSSITFSSIPQTYTDLVLVTQVRSTGSSFSQTRIRYNGDSGSNYSGTVVLGNGTAASSYRETNATEMLVAYDALSSSTAGYFSPTILNIMDYANTTTYKTLLARSSNAVGNAMADVFMWRNTAAVTSISVITATHTFDTGCIFKLYGIEAAK
jgi:hypothetical protein